MLFVFYAIRLGGFEIRRSIILGSPDPANNFIPIADSKSAKLKDVPQDWILVDFQST